MSSDSLVTVTTVRPTASLPPTTLDTPTNGVAEIPSITTTLASILLPLKRDSTLDSSTLDSSTLTVSVFNPEYLLNRTRWIRDILDPQIARQGPDTLSSDEVLQLDDLLRKLLAANLSQTDLRYSRLHIAVEAIASRATRWPARLVERCDLLKSVWEERYGGPLKGWGTMLYESDGGRLHGICRPEDTTTDGLLTKWIRQPDAHLNPACSRRCGDLGFVPGDWWISPLFAIRAGIIGRTEANGGIVADSRGAYAVVMTDGDEIPDATPYTFQYRTKNDDPGRYRLTSGDVNSRNPIRVLRTHTLHGFWRPRAGIRYDGLHEVTGWSIQGGPNSLNVSYIVRFRRLSTENDMSLVLCRPWSDEAEDYVEYRRVRRGERMRQGLSAHGGVDGFLE